MVELLKRAGRLPWLRPDAKSQVTIRYVDGKPESIETVVLSTQHAPEIDHKQLTYRYAGRDFRLTDVHGNVVRDILQ